MFIALVRRTKQSKTPVGGGNDVALSLRSANQLPLAKDGKGVLIRLNERDTKVFAELTRKFQGRILFVQCTKTLIEGMRITAPIEDGCVEWRHPRPAEVAAYLRKRFRIGEFK